MLAGVASSHGPMKGPSGIATQKPRSSVRWERNGHCETAQGLSLSEQRKRAGRSLVPKIQVLGQPLNHFSVRVLRCFVHQPVTFLLFTR